MTASFAPLLRLDRKTILVGLAALMLCASLIRFAVSTFQEKAEEIEVKETTLFAQQKSSRRLPALKKELAMISREAKKAETLFFQGPNPDAITSTIQIRLQSIIADAGLEPESLRPLGGKGKDGPVKSISIKLRVNGSLESFAEFLAAIYRNDKFFFIENCTLKPDKLKGVKVFMDLKAYYTITEKPSRPTKASKVRRRK